MKKYNYNDFINKQFGKLTIIDIFNKELNNKKVLIAKCRCECGNIIEKRFYDIRDGKITSCGKCNSVLLINQRFGKLTVIDTFYKKTNKSNELWCKCQCECGNIVDVSGSNLKRGHIKSCGKCDMNLLLNKTFGKLTVVDTYYKNENGKNKLWCKCLCECGNTMDTRANGLKNNNTKSCGHCNDKLLIGKTFGEIKVIDTFYVKNDKNKNELWCNCKCSCGKDLSVRARSLIRKQNPQISCGCVKISKGQKIIEDWLNKNNIYFTKEETFNKDIGLQTDKCNYLRFDIFIPDKNVIIEFDGIQHFYPIEMWGGEKALLKTKEHDEIKNNWAIENNIPLIRFNYRQSKKEIEDILQTLLL